MDLYLSKLIPLFIYPLGFALVMSVLAMGILGLSARLARLFLFVAVTVLWLTSTPMFADYLGLTLERQYPPVSVEETPTADVIVVLGGAVGGPERPRITVDLSDATDRVLHTARLYRAGNAPVVLISGGGIPWLGSDIPEAGSIQTLLEEWGVPGTSIIAEAASRNTYENAVLSKALLVERGLQRVLLVTSALHMPRALATFQSAGIDAVPAATDFTVTYKDQRTVIDFLPDAEALSRTTHAIKEYVGYAYYWWKGWIDDSGTLKSPV
ncbi:YdcF family protein [Desulfosarcina sp.]|nr:YdcF family protein [Desulfosarcina sp.]